LQAATDVPLAVGQTEQGTPVSSPEAKGPSALFSATDNPALAEPLTLRGNSAGGDVQPDSNSGPSADQVAQAAPASGSKASDSPLPLSATDHPSLSELTSQLGKFAGAEINLKVSGSESRQASAPEKSTTGSVPLGVGALSSNASKTVLDAVQIPAGPKAENQVDIPAKVTPHSAQVSGSMATEVAWQKGNEPETANAHAPISSLASSVPIPSLEANSQPATAARPLQNGPAPEDTGIQPSGPAYTSSSDGGAHANLADSSASGQGKPGQQTGSGSGDNSASVIGFAPNFAGNPSPDPAAGLLTAHAPSILLSHVNPAAPQTPPSSSQPAATLSAWQNYDGGAGKIVRSASLSDSANGAEMHVELRTGALGPLDVHAVVHEGSVGAEIHVQGQEAHTLLAAGLPSLERALGERNLRVENITIYHDQVGGGMSGGEKQDQQSGSSPSPQHQVLPWNSLPQPSSAASGSSEDEELANPATGLSVQA
jgi:flagellar hook-length control protein FliK